jgi:hypothetical protein
MILLNNPRIKGEDWNTCTPGNLIQLIAALASHHIAFADHVKRYHNRAGL